MVRFFFLLLISFSSLSWGPRSGEAYGAERQFQKDQELRIVQNRVHSKSGRFSLGASFGFVNNDPFLSSSAFLGSAAFNLSEVFGIGVLYWKVMNSPSSTAVNLVQATGFGANNNPIQSIISGEIIASILYGKLSLIGKSIIHYDLFILGGAGSISANNGNSIAPMLGIGEQIFLTRFLALKVDYRVFRFDENILEINHPGPTFGQVIGSRTNYTGILSFGFNFWI